MLFRNIKYTYIKNDKGDKCMLNDIEIAQQAHMANIKDVAASIGIAEDDIEMYGKFQTMMMESLYL